MKTNKTILLILSIFIPIFGCEKNEQGINIPSDIEISSVTFSDCNPETKLATSDVPSIYLKKQDNYLRIRAKNTEFCCGTDSITVDYRIDGRQLSVEIIDNGPFTYCYCPRDVEFLIGPFTKDDFSLTFIESEHSYSRDTFNITFDFSKNIDTLISKGYMKNQVDIDISSINLFFDEEDIDENNNPVCLRFNISSNQLYENKYLLEEHVTVIDNNIFVEIQNIKDLGKCEHPLHLSSLPPSDSSGYLCPASSKYFTISNLSRGIYNIGINIQGNSYNGSLYLYDQIATLNFQGNDVNFYDSIIHIVPDSSFFGTYYSLNSDSIGFEELVDKLLELNCKQIKMQPGIYRNFEIDNTGNLIFNPGQKGSEPTFIFKYDLNIDKILTTIKDYLDTSKDAYGVIIRDYLGNYYNIKNEPN